ncbi:autotransporter-associated beta strand repeat-containing protein [Bradyrhizobium altum]|uniref:autotransporter-associated beta strand repeat-containing protein n=1 Tax=Bradyrhizobium altum TaxID=1571202 RepID=UPI0035DA2084
MIKHGAATLTLNGANTFTCDLNAGTLALGAGGSLAANRCGWLCGVAAAVRRQYLLTCLRLKL